MKNLEPHQQRVVDERTELNDKIDKLNAFIQSGIKTDSIYSNLPEEDQNLLIEQSDLMMKYSDVLLKRINRFSEPKTEETLQKPRELTFGEKAMGVSFNPSKNPSVDKIKKQYAAIADTLNDFRNDPLMSGENKRLASVGITEAQGAQMWAVKALTWTE